MYVLSKNHRYKILQSLKKGGQASIYQCKDRHTGRVVALKIYKGLHRTRTKTDFETEVKALQIVQPNHGVVQLLDTWRTYNDGYLALELCSGSLDPLIYGALQPLEVREVAQFLVRVVSQLHSAHIQHNDIKPDNILRCSPVSGSSNQEHYRLCDFGLCYIGVDHQPSANFRGTLDYLAPELVDDNHVSAVFGASDIWALGVSLFELSTGHVPFYHKSPTTTMELIIHTDVDYSAIQDPVFIDFLKQTFIKSPLDRATIEQLKCHPYLLPPLALDKSSKPNN